MLTLFEISEKYRVPYKKIKAMHDAKVFSSVRETSDLEELRIALKRGNSLSSCQRVQIARNPEWIKRLDEYRGLLRPYKKAMANLRDDMPAELFPLATITNAARKDGGAVQRLARWIAGIIPADGCDYHYIAVRALWNVPDDLLQIAGQSMSRAIVQARLDPALEGMSAVENKQTRFFRRSFDL